MSSKRASRLSLKLGIGIAFLLSFVFFLGIVSIQIYFASGMSFQDNWSIDPSRTSYYYDTYGENRDDFRKSCNLIQRKIPATTLKTVAIPSRIDSDLTIDFCDIPSSKNPRKLILTSGIHGEEGNATSAIQRRLMEILSDKPDRPSLLFIHGINPYGMKYHRRVTENNIDLNRNFELSRELFSVQNTGYGRLNSLLNPDSPLDLESLSNRFFVVRSIYYLLLYGMDPLRQAILQGQYDFEKGIYYGGNDFSPQKGIMETVFREAGKGQKLVLLIDLHTGFGERGTAHLFPNVPRKQKTKELTEKIFAGYQIDWGDSDDFYSTYGDFSDFGGKVMGDMTEYVPMTLEYGTMNSQDTKGSIESIRLSILENQSFQYGCTQERFCETIRQQYHELFFPTSPAWRTKVMVDSEKLISDAMEKMNRVH